MILLNSKEILRKPFPRPEKRQKNKLRRNSKNRKRFRGESMLKAAIVFFVLGLFAIILGASGVGGLSIEIGRLLLFAFIVLSLWGVFVTYLGGKKPH